VVVVVGLVLVLGVTVSQGEWEMTIHKGQEAEVHAVADIDSVTFAFAHPIPMVLVPAGVFIMGDGDTYCGHDEHEVTLTQEFYLGQHEVTNQEYLEAVQWAYDHGYVTATTASIKDNLDGSSVDLMDLNFMYSEIQFDGAGTFYLQESPSSWALAAYPDGYDPADHPAKEMTWYGAARYCDWLSLQVGFPRAYEHTGDWSCNGSDPYGAEGYRLPTDAEWEYTAQWNDERAYPWGDMEPSCDYANYFGEVASCIGWTTLVGNYPSAPATLGFSDMAGNVREWCNDHWECELGNAPVTNPSGPSSGSVRVIRGGSWDLPADNLRCAYRAFYSNPSDGDNDLGFRVAKTAGN